MIALFLTWAAMTFALFAGIAGLFLARGHREERNFFLGSLAFAAVAVLVTGAVPYLYPANFIALILGMFSNIFGAGTATLDKDKNAIEYMFVAGAILFAISAFTVQLVNEPPSWGGV